MEILGFCLLFWASGTLPWSGQTNKLLVAEAKKRCVNGRQECNKSMTSFFSFLFSYQRDASRLVKNCFQGIAPGYLMDYMSAIYRLDYSERPAYETLRKIFSDQLGCCDPIKTLEWLSSSGSPVKVC